MKNIPTHALPAIRNEFFNVLNRNPDLSLWFGQRYHNLPTSERERALWTYEAPARWGAFGRAAEVASRIGKTTQPDEVLELMRRAGLVYIPAQGKQPSAVDFVLPQRG